MSGSSGARSQPPQNASELFGKIKDDFDSLLENTVKQLDEIYERQKIERERLMREREKIINNLVEINLKHHTKEGMSTEEITIFLEEITSFINDTKHLG